MQIDHFILSPSDWVPNHPTLPVLVYSQIRADMDSSAFEDMFHDNCWTGIWRNGVFAYHHYHSGAHEVLGVGAVRRSCRSVDRMERYWMSGKATACFCLRERGISGWKARAIFRWLALTLRGRRQARRAE